MYRFLKYIAGGSNLLILCAGMTLAQGTVYDAFEANPPVDGGFSVGPVLCTFNEGGQKDWLGSSKSESGTGPISGTERGAFLNVVGVNTYRAFGASTEYYYNQTIGAMTCSFWARWSSPTDWSCAGGYVTANPGINFWMDRNGSSMAFDSGEIGFFIRDSSRWFQGGTVGKNYADGAWHNIVWEYDKTRTSCMRLFVDNVEVSITTNAYLGAISADLGGAFALGARYLNGTPERYFNGALDDFLFFQKVLTDDQRTEIYERGLANK